MNLHSKSRCRKYYNENAFTVELSLYQNSRDFHSFFILKDNNNNMLDILTVFFLFSFFPLFQIL